MLPLFLKARSSQESTCVLMWYVLLAEVLTWCVVCWGVEANCDREIMQRGLLRGHPLRLSL